MAENDGRNYTTNLGLVLPKQSEQYNIDDFNTNSQLIDDFAGQVPPRALVADELTVARKINGVSFKGDADITLPIVDIDNESIEKDDNGIISVKDIYSNKDLSNLSVAGNSRLNALKGYLDDGEVLTDAEGLADVITYAHSTFDSTKFTVVGTPTITNDGIASGFTNDDYLSKSITLDSTKTFDIHFKFRTPNVIDEARQIIGNSGSPYPVINYRIETSKKIMCEFSITASTRHYVNSTFTVTENTDYFGKISYDKTDVIFYISTDNKNWTTLATFSTITDFIGEMTFIEGIGRAIGYVTYAHPFTGTIDLKQFYVLIDGAEIFSGNKTGIDTIKPDNYTVVGTPTITADGIEITNNSGDYLITPIKGSDLINKNWVIEGEIVNDGRFVNGSFNRFLDFQYNYAYQSYGSIFAYIGNLTQITAVGFQAKVGDSADSTTDGTKIQFDVTKQKTDWKSLKYRLEYDSSTKTYTMYHAFDNDTFVLTGSYTATTSDGNLYIWNTQTDKYISFDGFFAHDLNAFKIYVDGNLVYQPCLKIPYTQSASKYGSKIVDVAYRARVQDAWEQNYLQRYYTLDEVNGNFTLPQGEIYGMTLNQSVPHVIESYQNGTSWYRVWSDKWCEQGGEVLIPGQTGSQIVFIKPYANTDYMIMLTSADYQVDATPGVTAGSQSQYGFYADYPSGENEGNVYWTTKGFIS